MFTVGCFTQESVCVLLLLANSIQAFAPSEGPYKTVKTVETASGTLSQLRADCVCAHYILASIFKRKDLIKQS
jgi:hypothetical protein